MRKARGIKQVIRNHGILELKTNTKKGKRKSKETAVQNIEGKGNEFINIRN